MKKIIAVLTCMFILISFSAMACAEDEISVYLDGKKLSFDVPPMIVNDRTLVPVRAIFEAMGADVIWDAEKRTVDGFGDGIYVSMKIDDTEISVNSVITTIDVPAQIYKDRTLVPLRVVSECLGATVEWDGFTKTIMITSANNIGELEWNDNYYYVGEISGGEASGYGMIFKYSDNSLRQMGLYDNSIIIAGTDVYDNESFTGTYMNGNPSDGIYYYSNGDYYSGELLDLYRHGSGTYYYSDGSFLKGKWDKNKVHGYGIYYDAVEDVQFQGNYTQGKRDGQFRVDDFYTGESYYVTYKNGEYYDARAEAYAELDAKAAQLAQDYEELDQWYLDELEELNDYILNGDPYSTDWAKSIYRQYGVGNNYYGSAGSNGGNIDSFAAANAARQNAALKAQADEAIRAYNQTYINNWRDLIETTYTQQRKILDREYEQLLKEIEEFDNTY